MKYYPEVRQDKEGVVKRDYREHADELHQKFEQYRNRIREDSISIDNCYPVAHDILDDVDFNLGQVDSLQLLFENTDPYFDFILGNFISAAYNLADQDMLIYQTETDHKPNIGYNLPQRKTLFLKSDTAESGCYSEGTIINRESVKFGFAQDNGGLAINLGEIEGDFATLNDGVAINFGQIGQSPSKNVFLNFGRVEKFDYYPQAQGLFLSTKQLGSQFKEYASSNDNIVTPVDVVNNQRLKDYLKELEEGLTGSDEKMVDFLSEISPNPDDTIRRNLTEFVGDSD